MPPISVIRMLLVDDHAIVREGLCAVLGRFAELRVVAEAATGLEAIAQYRKHRPDVAIVDLRLPDISGIEVVRTLTADDPNARLLVLTSAEGDHDVRLAVAAGASGFLFKGAIGCDIVRAIRQVYAGNQWIAPEVREALRGKSDPDLSRRELEVLTLLAQGLRNQEIGDFLGLALNTVKVHVQAVLLKLDVSDRTEAAVCAIKRGLVRLP